MEWHREVITAAVESALQDLLRQSVLEGFYLAGGTGLALSLGHRRSVDLDFFSERSFDSEALQHKLHALEALSVVSRSPDTLHLQIRTVKVSFLGFPHQVLFPCGSFLEVEVADPRDIACMKLSALAGRGARRDFIDVYAAAQRYGLAELLELFQRRFARVNYSRLHVLKSLVYFEDAEKDPMPEMLAEISWTEVKRFFAAEAARLA